MLLVLFVFSFLAPCLSQSGNLCPHVANRPSCVCDTGKGIIDLTPVVGHGKQPRFTKVQYPYSDRTDVFAYNPCYKYSQSTCTDCFVCDIDSTGYDFCRADSTEDIYIETDGTPYAFYTGITSVVKVYLNCTKSEDPVLVSKGAKTSNDGTIETFILSSCHSCPGGCKTASVVGLAGLMVIIVLVFAVLAYFLIGAIVLKVKYDANTGMDMIPHKNFWKEFGLLIKDGCVLTCAPVKKMVNRDRYGYDPIK